MASDTSDDVVSGASNDTPTVADSNQQEGHRQGESDDESPEGGAGSPDRCPGTRLSTKSKTAQRQLANYLQNPENSDDERPLGGTRGTTRRMREPAIIAILDFLKIQSACMSE